MGRISLVGMLLGVCLALGCYNVPQPVCGFFCGAGGACPDDYTCNTADNRCHLNGSPSTMCSSQDAGPVDTTDATVFDVPGDGNTPPSVTGTTPSNGATGVSVVASVSATFSEQVIGVSGGTFTLMQGGSGVPGNVIYTNSTPPFATYNQTTQLAANTTYTATLTSGITDTQGASLPTEVWVFTTGADQVSPAVTSTTPLLNATNVGVLASISFVFDEQVMGVSGSTVTVMAGATPITGNVTYSMFNRTATFTPTMQYPGNTVITATLSSGITDTSSNPLSGAPYTLMFTTGADTVRPTVQSTTPLNGATNVSTGTMITVVFDEPVLNVDLTSFTVNDGAAVAGSLASGTGGRSWTFTPSAALAATASVTVTLSTAITDAATNALVAPVTFMFTTQ